MVPFGAEHAAVHCPKDRRFRIWVRPAIRIGIAVVALALVLASWIEFAAGRSAYCFSRSEIFPNNFTRPHGFPICVRYCHFFNFLFLMMLIRSGLL